MSAWIHAVHGFTCMCVGMHVHAINPRHRQRLAGRAIMTANTRTPQTAYPHALLRGMLLCQSGTWYCVGLHHHCCCCCWACDPPLHRHCCHHHHLLHRPLPRPHHCHPAATAAASSQQPLSAWNLTVTVSAALNTALVLIGKTLGTSNWGVKA